MTFLCRQTQKEKSQLLNIQKVIICFRPFYISKQWFQCLKVIFIHNHHVFINHRILVQTPRLAWHFHTYKHHQQNIRVLIQQKVVSCFRPFWFRNPYLLYHQSKPGKYKVLLLKKKKKKKAVFLTVLFNFLFAWTKWLKSNEKFIVLDHFYSQIPIHLSSI